MDKSQTHITIRDAAKTPRVVSFPVAALFTASLMVVGIGALDWQAARRIRRALVDQQWRPWKWEGVVHGPGRGRVRVAGILTSPVHVEQYLLVNALGCWREGLDALSEPGDVSVAGDPRQLIVVRHHNTLRPVLLRPPNSNKAQAAAFEMLGLGDPVLAPV